MLDQVRLHDYVGLSVRPSVYMSVCPPFFWLTPYFEIFFNHEILTPQ